MREWRVFDNTALDYALKIDDAPALYVRILRTSSSSLRRSITHGLLDRVEEPSRRISGQLRERLAHTRIGEHGLAPEIQLAVY